MVHHLRNVRPADPAGHAERVSVGGERSPWSARAQAHVAAYELLERAQSEPDPAQVHRRLHEAERNGWHEVKVLLHYALMATDAMAGGGNSIVELTEMFAAAEAADDTALLALCLATRAERSAHSPHTLQEEEAALARAVALLDEEGGSAVDRPTAYVACALGYQARGLWELEEEMYVRACTELSARLPAPFDRAQDLTARVVLANRFDACAAWACALMELGARGDAREVARQVHSVDPAARSSMPWQWQADLIAVEYLLAAIASEPEPRPFGEVLAGLSESIWPGYRSCALLGLAIRKLDDGDLDGCAALGEQAIVGLDRHIHPTILTLAMKLAAVAESAPATVRHAQEVGRLRWQARLHQLSSARVRLEAERVMLENDRLTQHAYVDELTGLPNRRAYARQIKRLRHNPPGAGVAVMMIDVDHFKRVNDRFGHSVGDEVLRRLGELLARHSRPGDLVARLGGDEFVMILDLARPLEATARAEGLVRAVADQRWAELTPGLQVTVSTGLASGSSPQVDDLLTAADRCLYRAKSNGRGRMVAASHQDVATFAAAAPTGPG
jgi:diguanylate cyclase (GGDEF)-like protein